jgi:hypothetical protein
MPVAAQHTACVNVKGYLPSNVLLLLILLLPLPSMIPSLPLPLPPPRKSACASPLRLLTPQFPNLLFLLILLLVVLIRVTITSSSQSSDAYQWGSRGQPSVVKIPQMWVKRRMCVMEWATQCNRRPGAWVSPGTMIVGGRNLKVQWNEEQICFTSPNRRAETFLVMKTMMLIDTWLPDLWLQGA